MSDTQSRTVQPILSSDDDSKIIQTLNRNFQVLTERIKELNLSISSLDVLKISQIFTITSDQYPSGTEAQIAAKQASNLQQFVTSCWNTLANYNGVYIQYIGNGDNPLFKWNQVNDVYNGDFIIKLPNNQSLYIPGQKPIYMVPTAYNSSNGELSYTAQNIGSTAATVVTLNFPTVAAVGLVATYSYANAGTVVSYNNVRSIRYYWNGEEVFFEDGGPRSAYSYTVPITVMYYVIYGS